MKQFLISLKMYGILAVVTGILYPLAITVLAQCIFNHKANGSMVVAKGTVIGSELIGQQFTSARYFQSRPSAIGYNPLPSGASNFSVISRQLKDSVVAREKTFQTWNGLSDNRTIPAEMLFASGSGLDPDISPEAARLQIGRIARERALTNDQMTTLTALVERSIIKPQLGFLGQERINVFNLNTSLDQLTQAQ
jgi:potassium-transporting ATPase KdpC subunit